MVSGFPENHPNVRERATSATGGLSQKLKWRGADISPRARHRLPVPANWLLAQHCSEFRTALTDAPELAMYRCEDDTETAWMHHTDLSDRLSRRPAITFIAEEGIAGAKLKDTSFGCRR